MQQEQTGISDASCSVRRCPNTA